MFAPRFLIRDGHELQFFFYMDRGLEEKSKSTIFRRLGDLIRDSNGIATRGGIDQECVHICLGSGDSFASATICGTNTFPIVTAPMTATARAAAFLQRQANPNFSGPFASSGHWA